MKLHYANMTACSRRVSVTVALLEETTVEPRRPDDRAALRAIDLDETIPVLEDGARVRWEARARMQSPSNKTPGPRLDPAELAAQVERLRVWLSGEARSGAAWKQTARGRIG